MISNLYSNSLNISAVSPLPYINSAGPAAGQICVHQGQLRVYDGSSWQVINTAQNIELQPLDKMALDWAKSKMCEENRISELAEKNITVADALAELKNAQEKLQVVMALCDLPK